MVLSATLDTIGGYAQFITVLLLFVLVLWVTWAVTKWTAGYQKGKWNSGNIELLESFRIAADKYVQIIRVTDQYFAIAVSKESITFLAKLDENALKQGEDADSAKMSFKEWLEKVREKKEE